MDLPSKTFCSAPWFQIRNQQNGSYRPCCEIDIQNSEFVGNQDYQWPKHVPDEFLNSDYMQYLRQGLMQGKKMPECNRCWEKENLGQRSMRQSINNSVTNNRGNTLRDTWLESYFSHKNDFEFDLLISADVKLSNLCNFSCAMCNAEDSSQIYAIWCKEIDNPLTNDLFPKEINYYNQIRQRYSGNSNYDLLEHIISRRPKHLKLLGGEPLMDKQMLDILLKVPSQIARDISLVFVTNGSHDLLHFADALEKYRQINYVVSLEGTGAVQDFIRRGSKWNSIKKNISAWNAVRRPVDIHLTLQALNFFHLPDLVVWCKKRSLHLTMTLVSKPAYLSIAAIPETLRNRICEVLLTVSNVDIQIDDININCGTLSSLFESHAFDSISLERLKRFMKWYDPENHWVSILPEWQGILD